MIGAENNFGTRAGSLRSSAGRSNLMSRFVFAIDDRLRERHGVFEFTRDTDTIFRAQLHPCGRDVALKDGSRAAETDRILDIHLWNEQLPVLEGRSLQWARLLHGRLDHSLRELYRFLCGRPDLDDVQIIRANMSFGTAERTAQLVRISGTFGFEPIPDPRAPALAQRLHQFGENILISMMVLGRNRHAFRWDSLTRHRIEVFVSRAALAARYKADVEAGGSIA